MNQIVRPRWYIPLEVVSEEVGHEDDEVVHVVLEQVEQVERPPRSSGHGEEVLDALVKVIVVPSQCRCSQVCCFRQYGKHKVSVNDQVSRLHDDITVTYQNEVHVLVIDEQVLVQEIEQVVKHTLQEFQE